MRPPNSCAGSAREQLGLGSAFRRSLGVLALLGLWNLQAPAFSEGARQGPPPSVSGGGASAQTPASNAEAEPRPTAVTPRQAVQRLSDELAALLRTRRMQLLLEPEFLQAQVRRLLDEHLAEDALAERILGPYWRDATAQQQSAFKAEFRRMLERSAAVAVPFALSVVQDWELRFAPMPPVDQAKRTPVRFELRLQQRKLNIEAHLERQGPRWQVFDVSVNGLGLSDLYSRSFRERARREGITGLISALRSWNQQQSGASS